MREQRSGERWPSRLTGHILLDEGRSLECEIRDFSSAGAKIVVGSETRLPDAFEVVFPLTRATFRAHVRWRRGQEIGVAFEQFADPEKVVPTDPIHAMLLERLHVAELEKAAMQSRMAQLLAMIEHVG